jgi:two-component system sensor kinase FixL
MQVSPKRDLTVRTAMDGDAIEVAVSDTGPGLSDEVAARLFQPFVTTKEKGMGIGLTICQSIIEAHNGRIWATPNHDGGVEFHFRLPMTPMD